MLNCFNTVFSVVFWLSLSVWIGHYVMFYKIPKLNSKKNNMPWVYRSYYMFLFLGNFSPVLKIFSALFLLSIVVFLVS